MRTSDRVGVFFLAPSLRSLLSFETSSSPLRSDRSDALLHPSCILHTVGRKYEFGKFKYTYAITRNNHVQRMLIMNDGKKRLNAS